MKENTEEIVKIPLLFYPPSTSVIFFSQFYSLTSFAFFVERKGKHVFDFISLKVIRVIFFGSKLRGFFLISFLVYC